MLLLLLRCTIFSERRIPTRILCTLAMVLNHVPETSLAHRPFGRPHILGRGIFDILQEFGKDG